MTSTARRSGSAGTSEAVTRERSARQAARAGRRLQMQEVRQPRASARLDRELLRVPRPVPRVDRDGERKLLQRRTDVHAMLLALAEQRAECAKAQHGLIEFGRVAVHPETRDG